MSNLKLKTNMSITDIISFARNLYNSMQKDSSYFLTRGVTISDIQAFGDLYDELKYLETDNENFAKVRIAVEEKTEVRSAVIKTAWEVRSYFIVAFGRDSENYKRLSTKKIEGASDNMLVSLLYDEVRIAEELLSELSAVGLTQADIDKLKTETDALALKVDKVADAKAIRRTKTKERIEN